MNKHSIRPTSITRRAAVLGTVAAAAILTAAGCSTDSTDTATTGASSFVVDGSPSQSAPAGSATDQQHNSADIMFNQMMIPHHRQAVEMAGMVESRTQNAAVRQLATAIAAAQQPEIDQMTARLTSWGVPVMAGGDHGGMSMGGDHSMSGSGMSGMMSDAQMSAISSATGAQFDTLWLQGMITHHEGAVEMANTELAKGIDPGSRELATQIKTAQLAEIAEMKKMLGQ